MNSKIIKISFVLVFILITMGFFNSVFAFGEYNNLSNFNVGEGIVDPSGSGNPTYYYNTSVIDVTSFPYISASNVNLTTNGSGGSLSSSQISELNTYVINYLANTTASPIPVVYYVAYDDSSHNSYLRCDLSIPNTNNINNPTYSYTYSTSGYCYYSSYLCYSFKYYNGEWYRSGVGSKFYFNTLSSSGLTCSQVWLLNNVGDITFKRSDNSTFFTAEYQEPMPTNEELTADCNLNVNFKFQPKSSDFPNDNVTPHPLYSYKCLITHDMLNWENYNIKFSLEKNVQGESWNNTYYDFYDINGNKLVNKQEILYNSYTLQNLSEDDFIYIFADNKFDVIKLKYYIYNTNNELLFTKTYTFKFTEDGLTVSSATGTVLTENTQNSNGEDISNTNTSFNTNGYNNTNALNTDYYDVGSINSLTNNAADTINLAKECFSILPGFVWAMVGIFLSVCIALRILGR